MRGFPPLRAEEPDRRSQAPSAFAFGAPGPHRDGGVAPRPEGRTLEFRTSIEEQNDRSAQDQLSLIHI